MKALIFTIERNLLFCCCCYFLSNLEIYLWSVKSQIYFIKFSIQQINTVEDKINIFHWFIEPNFISRKKWFKSSLITLPALSQIMSPMLSLFKCITRSSPVSLEERKSNFSYIRFLEIILWFLSSMISSRYFLSQLLSYLI